MKNVVLEHKKHKIDINNEVEILKLNKLISKMASDTTHEKHTPSALYTIALRLFAGNTLPLKHKKKSIKSIENVRYRAAKKNSVSKINKQNKIERQPSKVNTKTNGSMKELVNSSTNVDANEMSPSSRESINYINH